MMVEQLFGSQKRDNESSKRRNLMDPDYKRESRRYVITIIRSSHHQHKQKSHWWICQWTWLDLTWFELKMLNGWRFHLDRPKSLFKRKKFFFPWYESREREKKKKTDFWVSSFEDDRMKQTKKKLVKYVDGYWRIFFGFDDEETETGKTMLLTWNDRTEFFRFVFVVCFDFLILFSVFDCFLIWCWQANEANKQTGQDKW